MSVTRKQPFTAIALKIQADEVIALGKSLQAFADEMKRKQIETIEVDGSAEFHRGKKKVRNFIANVIREIV